MNRFSPSTPRIPGIRFVHSPGPTHVPDEVMHAMQRPMTDLSDPRVAAMIAECESGMKRLLHSPNAEVFLFASNGHGMWESAAANLASPQHTLLLAGSGHFSDQWAIQIEGLGIALQRTPYQEGHPFDVAAIEQALREDTSHRISAVMVVHTETASGVTSDLAAVRRAIDAAAHPALYVVDVVASLAASPFDMDALGVDVALGSSQKGLMMPPGLGFVAVNAKAMAWSARHAEPRFYWDWQRRDSDNQSAKFCGTRRWRTSLGWRWPLPCWKKRVYPRSGRGTNVWRVRCTRRSSAGRCRGPCAFMPASPTRVRPRSPPSRWPRESTPKLCAPWPASVFRWPCPGAWGHWLAGCFALATWAT